MKKLKPKKITGVYRRKDTGRFYYSPMRDGKRVRVDLETGDEGEAYTRAAALLDSPALAPSGGLQTAITDFLADKQRFGEYTENSADRRADSLSLLVTHFGDCAPVKINREQAQGFYDWLTNPRSLRGRDLLPVSANSYVTHCSAFWKWLIAKQCVHTNPWPMVKRIRVPKGAGVCHDFLSYPAFTALIQNAPSHELRFILFCGFHCGLRKDEIVNSRPEWFDIEGRIIRVLSTTAGKTVQKFHRKTVKTDAGIHTVPLSEEFLAFLRTWDGWKTGPYCIAPEVVKGRSRYRYDFRRPYEMYLRSQEQTLTVHGMRHSFASHCVMRDVPFIKIAKWMGDSLKTVEKHYAHLRPDDRSIDQAFPSHTAAAA